MDKRATGIKIYVIIILLSAFWGGGCEKQSVPVQESGNAQQSEISTEDRTELAARFESHLKELYDDINFKDLDLNYDVFRYAMIGYYNLKQENKLNERQMVSIIDFTKSSCDRRFYTIDLEQKEVIFHSVVSHGVNTGGEFAENFSNIPESRQSSFGMYVTGNTYQGKHGLSLRLHGVDTGYNEKAFERAIVMHGADYANDNFIKSRGMLGRSWGCPALPTNLNEEVVQTIKENTLLFAYYNDDTYLNASSYLDLERILKSEEITSS